MTRERTLEYRSWESMKQRCTNTNDPNYPRYGGRGISYDERWENFADFLADMGERPPGTTLDRKDNEDGYYKENCRWATPTQQARNRRPQTVEKQPRKSNTSGITGVSWLKSQSKWVAYAMRSGKQRDLYRGPNFFEACCARKSWEATQI